MTENDLYYLAGFFDGEGTCTVRYVLSKNGKKYKRLEARIAQADCTYLHWLKDTLGYGRVHGKYDNRPNECYDFVVYYKQARQFLTLLQPYLRQKKDRVALCLKQDRGDT